MSKEYAPIVHVGSMMNLPLESYYFDDFEKPAKYTSGGVGVGERTRSAIYAATGLSSFLMSTRDAGATDGDYVFLAKRISRPTSKKAKFAAGFWRPNHASYLDFQVTTGAIAAGEDDCEYVLRFNFDNNKIQIKKADGSWADAADDISYLDIDNWIFFELTLDLMDKKYLTIRSMSQEFDVSAYAPEKKATSYGGAALLYIKLTNKTTPGKAYTYIDNILFARED